MTNVLYFEGAGMNFYDEAMNHSDVGNFRIRTSFYNNEGVQYYIEMGRSARYNEKHKVTSEYGLRIDHLFKVENRNIAEFSAGGYEIKTNHLEIRELDYSKHDITNWINENLNCSFDTIEVLDDSIGYRVHSYDQQNGYELYNLMEDYA